MKKNNPTIKKNLPFCCLFIFLLILGSVYYFYNRSKIEIFMQPAKSKSVPTHSTADLSWLTIQAGGVNSKENIQMIIENPKGNVATEVNQHAIPNGYLGFEWPLTPPKSLDSPEGFWNFYQKDPENGEYFISIASLRSPFISVEIHSMNKNGDSFISKEIYDIGEDSKLVLLLLNDSEDHMKTTLEVME